MTDRGSGKRGRGNDGLWEWLGKVGFGLERECGLEWRWGMVGGSVERPRGVGIGTVFTANWQWLLDVGVCMNEIGMDCQADRDRTSRN
jgi:hypothetical protein